MARSARTGLATSLLAVGLMLTACAGNAGGRGAAAPGTAPGPARGTRPTQLLIAADSNLTDSNANGYPDTFQVVAYLFPEAQVSALPLWADGTFEFLLTTEDGGVLQRWFFDENMSEQARVQTAVGRAQSFFLRFGEGQDRIPPTVADLRGRYVSEDGSQTLTSGSTSVRVGARR